MSSPAAGEMAEKDHFLDHLQILKYIQGPMLRSRLIEVLGIQPDVDTRPSWDFSDESSPIYSRYKVDLKTFLQGSQTERKLPGMDVMIARLDRQCRVVFERIAETQKRKARFGDPFSLGRLQPRCLDMRMLIEVGPKCTACWISRLMVA